MCPTHELWVHIDRGPPHGPHAARWAFDGADVGRLRALSDIVKALNAEELVLARAPDTWLGAAGDFQVVGACMVIVADGFWFEARERQGDFQIETTFVDLALLESALGAATDLYVPDTPAVRGLVANTLARGLYGE